MRRMRRNKKGFTLIELVVVIAIIGILAMIVTVSTIAIMRNAQRNAAETAIRQYWRISSQHLDYVNKGLTTSNKPSKDALATLLSIDASRLTVSTKACSSLGEGKIYVQYKDNPQSSIARYTLVRITYCYKDLYYKMEDGSTITNSSSVS